MAPTFFLDTIRLVNGTNNGTHSSGRIEIRRPNDEWGTVCDDWFGNQEAMVICTMLGFTGGIARPSAYFGPGTGSIWMDDLRCTGNESSIFDCGHNGWGRHNCGHSEDAGVECGTSKCVFTEGYYDDLELNHDYVVEFSSE